MSKIDDGGPAFPSTHPHGREDGMTLRDYMAIHASADDIRDQAEIIRSAQLAAGGPGILPDNWVAKARYMHADAMLKVREQGDAA